MKQTNDTISRSGAIKAIEEKAKRIKNEDTLNGLVGAVAILFELPPATPESGKWIKTSCSWLWKCSKCNENYHEKMARRCNFCPNCGAYMVESEEQK